MDFYCVVFNVYYSQHMIFFEIDILHIWFSILFGLCLLDVVIYG
jgi:hypothetical protein